MKVCGYDPFLSVNAALKLSTQVQVVKDLDEIYKNCDYITIHIPYIPDQNKGLINSGLIRKMKDGVILINTARGPLVEAEALLVAIESGKIGAAGLDVVENEFGLYYYDRKNDVLDNRELALLRSYPNVTVTHHMAFYTDNCVKTTDVISTLTCYQRKLFNFTLHCANLGIHTH